MRRNVSHDRDRFKETKLLMFSSRRNVKKTGNFGRNFKNLFLFNFVDILNPQNLSARPNSFCELGFRVSPLFAALGIFDRVNITNKLRLKLCQAQV